MSFSSGEALARGFEGFDAQMSDMAEAFDLITEDFYEVEKEIFAKGGVPEPFRPLDPAYAKWKDRHFPGKPLMRLHDNLYKALTGEVPDDLTKARPVREGNKQLLILGFESAYGMRHQNTGRKVVQVSEATRERWGRIIHRWAYDKFRNEVARGRS